MGTRVVTAVAENVPAPLDRIVDEISALFSAGHEVIVVSSGAIGLGMKKMGLSQRPRDLRKKQAVAAIGQLALMERYEQLFARQKIFVAQVLLTRADFEDRKRYLNARSTLLTLLDLNVIPIINENDTVAVEEIQFGDNDRLSALVAAKINADLLVILTDVEGLYSGHAQKGLGGKGQLVSIVPQITPEVEGLVVKGKKSALGTGGMTSKLDAARIATASGVLTVVASGFVPEVLPDIFKGENVGTRFLPQGGLSAKDRWILFGAIPRGQIWVDAGARHAIKNLKKSLLPAGVTKVDGFFQKGDVVMIVSEDGKDLARGVVSMDSGDVKKIKGKKSSEIQDIIGRYAKSFEIVQCDSLILI